MQATFRYLVAPAVYLVIAVPTIALAAVTTIYSGGPIELLPRGLQNAVFAIVLYLWSPFLGFFIYSRSAQLLLSRGHHFAGWFGHLHATAPLYLLTAFLLGHMIVHGREPGYWILGGMILPLLATIGAILGDMKSSVQWVAGSG